MCDLTKGFKLCTCAGEILKPEDIDWSLQRKDESLPILHVKGKASIPEFTNKEEELKQNIIELLNKENCFDFDYQVQEGDFLKIRIDKGNNRWAAFRFLKGEWRNDTSTSLDSWRRQMVHFEKGKTKCE